MTAFAESHNPPVPTSYRGLLIFLLSGSGVWAMLAGIAGGLVLKLAGDGWDLLDYGIVAAFLLFRGVIEWLIHSYLYHARPLPVLGTRLESSVFEAHVRHHADPFDLATLLITWRGVIAVFLVVWLGGLVVFLDPGRGASLVVGFGIVGLLTEVVHLVCHCRIPHRSRLMTRLVDLHRRHHHQDSNNYYGVTSSLGDRLFRTFPQHD